MFYNQPLSIRFGTELLKHIDERKGIEPFWDFLDIAVAWVRASGVNYLEDSFTRFLAHGGQLSFIVGIDLLNTTKEGLQALLDLEKHGTCATYVYHNEGGSIFHPKIYLFRNVEEARLIVGSNNLTESGLFSNVEAGLQLDTELTNDVIESAADAITSWCDTSSKLVIRLDETTLDKLHDNGYIKEEAEVRIPHRKSKKRSDGSESEKLFGTRTYSPPGRKKKADESGKLPASSDSMAADSVEADPTGTAILMRLRKARGTQTQIPFRVSEKFFKGIDNVVSVQSGAIHGLNPAQAHGNKNTIKLEIPELKDFDDPYARFEKTPTGVIYEVHDNGSSKGNLIKKSLEEGMLTGSTQTSISDVSRATWWRYI
ncbi:phospholipase D-like domain-containing protein [Sneathiella sp. HT1-7]|uniref:phospholipase D-like domain-containing protein n=1 Tax=Sneathiella sp. HT1-7 TaxID=2887192 RepID=UPI001D14D794|nr:phospholipase D-like domain-containing protein [Sneathiella sp. HT1-7]MCC3306601.1 phospholipase D-like domain-containing protein [Sneathiella sp. HT1-7]